MKKKHKNLKLLLFAQTINDILYRGFVKVVYMDLTRFQNLGKCLYITHVIITPRKGRILDKELKRILNDMPNLLDSVYIESILSDKVLESFVSNDWTAYNNSVFIKNPLSGGKKKKTKKYKKHINKKRRRTYRKHKKSNNIY